MENTHADAVDLTGAKVVVTGAESTGKTMLAQALAESFSAPHVPETLRTWVDEVGRLPSLADMERVAHLHVQIDEEIRTTEARVVVYDTDLVSIAIYCRYYFDRCPSWIEREAIARRPDLYVLTADDIPWQADPQRESPAVRASLQRVFASRVPHIAPTLAVAGTPTERLEAARAEVEAVLQRLLKRRTGRRTPPP